MLNTSNLLQAQKAIVNKVMNSPAPQPINNRLNRLSTENNNPNTNKVNASADAAKKNENSSSNGDNNNNNNKKAEKWSLDDFEIGRPLGTLLYQKKKRLS